MNKPYLLDTCAVIWISQNERFAAHATDAITLCRLGGVPIYISSATAWEMAMLVARGRIYEKDDAKLWYDHFRRDGKFSEQAVTADIFIASCRLPQPIHKDPIDRILIATAREHDLTIITRDRAILDYGAAGHVRTLAC